LRLFIGSLPAIVLGNFLLRKIDRSVLSPFSFLNYALLGRVDYYIALFLALGTIPGVYLGAYINTRVDKERLKKIINVVILVIGVLILAQRVL